MHNQMAELLSETPLETVSGGTEGYKHGTTKILGYEED